ncbi:MAG: hypothetical protein V7K77_11915 [Nostoc sp.]|uniref:hypothetical protein n=1 Tax=Nostoc sp. TaxID=1180 RepID=UPI002FF9B783
MPLGIIIFLTPQKMGEPGAIAGKSSTRSEVVLFNCFIAASLIRECLCKLPFQAAIWPIFFQIGEPTVNL